MQVLTTLRRRGRKWRICPWISVRASIISLIAIVITAIILDRLVLSSLERRGLIASEGWKRHNRVVIENHQKKDRNIAFKDPKSGNSPGARAWLGHPVTKERSRQHRILVMGDSFVWDSPYLTLNHMWWRQLAIELHRRGYADVEVIAAGHSGMSTREELDLARHVVREFQPDLILWGFVTNDPDERIVKQIFNSQLNLPIPSRVQAGIHTFTPRLLDLIKARRADKLTHGYLGPEYGYEYSEWLQRIHEGKNFELYRRTVADVAEFLKQVQIAGLMVTLPEAPIADRFKFSYDKVLPVWRDAGIPVQDNLPAFEQRFPNVENAGPQALAWAINPADGHPGPHTTAVLAQLTADGLERDYAQFLGPKSTPSSPASGGDRPMVGTAHPTPPKSTQSSTIGINDWLPYNLNLQPQGEGKFRLNYPDTDELMPTMPLEIPTVLLALDQPQPLTQILLSGAGLKSARLWISTYDAVEHYDTQDWKDLGSHDGKNLNWNIPAELAGRDASVILLKAEFESQNRELELQLRRETQ